MTGLPFGLDWIGLPLWPWEGGPHSGLGSEEMILLEALARN